MHLIRCGALEGFESLIRSLGGNPVEQFRQVGISVSQLRDPNSFISYSKMAEVLEICSHACNAPFLGLLLAERNKYWVLSDLLVSISQDPTVAEALTKFDRHLYLHASGVHLTIASAGEEARLELKFDFTTPLGIDQLAQKAVGQTATVLSKLMAVDRYSFKLHLRQPRPPAESNNKSGFYPQIHFGSTFDGIRLTTKDLNRRPKLDDDTLQKHFIEHLQHLKARYPNNIKNQAKEIIGQLLPSGDCSMDKVASNLGLHPKTLQRKLQSENSNYRELLRESRQVIAEQYLSQGSVSITDLALNLGYAEVSEFSRHFKSWTGRPPKKWRQEKTRH